jgi:hypothetical protein
MDEARQIRRGQVPSPNAMKRRQDFIRIVNKRVPDAIDAVLRIGHLADKKNYRYGPNDVQKIEDALLMAVDRMLAKFRSPGEQAFLFEITDEGD